MKYDKVIQDLTREFDVLMDKYLQKLHSAFHEDFGLKYPSTDIINRIKQDCMSIYSNKLRNIASDERSEDGVIEEILEYNFDMTDIKHMKEVERVDLLSYHKSAERVLY